MIVLKKPDAMADQVVSMPSKRSAFSTETVANSSSDSSGQSQSGGSNVTQAKSGLHLATKHKVKHSIHCADQSLSSAFSSNSICTNKAKGTYGIYIIQCLQSLQMKSDPGAPRGPPDSFESGSLNSSKGGGHPMSDETKSEMGSSF